MADLPVDAEWHCQACSSSARPRTEAVGIDPLCREEVLCFAMPVKTQDPRDPSGKRAVRVVLKLRRPARNHPRLATPGHGLQASGGLSGAVKVEASPSVQPDQSAEGGSLPLSAGGPAAFAELHKMGDAAAKQHVLAYAVQNGLMEWEGDTCFVKLDAALKQVLGNHARLSTMDVPRRVDLYLQVFKTPLTLGVSRGVESPAEELPCGRRLGFAAAEGEVEASPCADKTAAKMQCSEEEEESAKRLSENEAKTGEKSTSEEEQVEEEARVARAPFKPLADVGHVDASLLRESSSMTLQTAMRGKMARNRLAKRKQQRGVETQSQPKTPHVGSRSRVMSVILLSASNSQHCILNE